MDEIKIVILVEDRNGACPDEHGFSAYFEYDNKKVLIDTGATKMFIENAKLLNIDINKVDTFVLSHGHYDHGSFINELSSGTTMIMHPDCFNYRIRKKTGNYGGINQDKDELESKYNLILSKGNYKITDNILYLSDIPRAFDFESNKFPMFFEDGTDDTVKEESAIVITSPNGLIIISPCSHSGICNIIEYAKKVTNTDKIHAVIGGFHMKEVDENTKKVISYFKDNNVENIYLGHCTSDEVCNEFINKLSDFSNVEVMSSGLTINLGKSVNKKIEL